MINDVHATLKKGLKSTLITVFALLFSVLTLRLTAAQSTSQAENRLTALVHLDLGETTVAAVTKALSEQTGLQVEASAYLRSRKLIVQMNSVSAETALDTLAELNGWRWFTLMPGHILITRKRVPLPQDAAEISPAIQAALPPDIRCFFGMGVPVNQLPVSQQASGIAARTKFSQPWEYGETLKARVVNRLQGFGQRQRSYLIPSADSHLLDVEPGKYEGRKLYYSQISSRQQDAVMLWMLAPVADTINLDVLLGILKPFVRDINTARFEMEGNTLWIKSRILYDEGKMTRMEGFGAQLLKDEPPKSP